MNPAPRHSYNLRCKLLVDAVLELVALFASLKASTMSCTEDRSEFVEHAECQRARAAIGARQAELEAQLLDLANINSGSYNSEGLEQVALALVKHARQALPEKPDFIRHPQTGELTALRWQRIAPNTPRVLLNGHLDTVYGSDSAFQSCTYSEDRRTINGPGVTDMKGGLVILFAALHSFLESELASKLSWEILITFDEEIGSHKSRPLLEQAAQSNDIGIVFESSLPDGSLIRNRMGTGTITVEAKGQAAHSGRDFERGKNAIVALSRFNSIAHELNATIAGAIINIAKMEGGGPANVVPDHARLEINVRAENSQAEQEVLCAIQSAAEVTSNQTGCQLAVSGGFTRPPKTSDAALERLIDAWQTTANAFGKKLTFKDTGGASDGNILQAAGLPNIDNLGARGNHIHSEQEYIECESLVSRSQLVASFLINLAAGKLDLTDLSK